jgi:hypothetical protein
LYTCLALTCTLTPPVMYLPSRNLPFGFPMFHHSFRRLHYTNPRTRWAFNRASRSDSRTQRFD